MTSKIQHILNMFNRPEDEKETQNLEIATSVLFIELAYADFNVATVEEEHIQKSMQSFFSLTSKEVADLISIARDKREQRNDIWFFTNQIKNNFNKDDKIRILEMFWGLVYADGHLDKYEEALMRKITTLLGLPHGEMIQAKLKAKNSYGIVKGSNK